MKFSSKIKTPLSLLMGLSIGATFIQVALAANPTIQTITFSPSPLYFNVPGQNAAISIDYDFNTGGYPTAPIVEEIRDQSDKIIYQFGTNTGKDGADDKATGHYLLKWDGKYKNGSTNDGQYVPNGKYKIYLYSETASLPAATYISPLFDAYNTVAPTVTLTSTPASIYYTTNNTSYNINYKLARGNNADTTVHLKITGPTGNNPVESNVSDLKTADGDYSIKWDGKNSTNTAPAGTYNYSLNATSSINGYNVDSLPVTGTFTVSNSSAPTSMLNGVTATPNPYNPDSGVITFGYTLSNSTGSSKITAGVYSTATPGTAIKSWTLDNQTNGPATVTWTGKDAVSNIVNDGTYVFKISGLDSSVTIPEQQLNFTVAKTQVTNCANFTDISSSDADCQAITYVKGLGAITGNPDGSFDGQGLLQRDQIAKIILETFKKFDKQVDYCPTANPFSDITRDNSWAYQYICRGKALGMITGYLSGADAGTYRAGRSVNRSEFLALLLRNITEAMPSTDSLSYSDIPAGQWYAGYAKYAQDKGLFTGSQLYPTNFVSRTEVARIIYKLHTLGKV